MGETDILLNQTRYTFRQGDLAVINSNVLHAGFCNGTPVEVLVVIFELDELSAQVAEKKYFVSANDLCRYKDTGAHEPDLSGTE